MAHEPDDGVPSRREERDQRAADQSAGPAHRDAEPRPLAVLGMRREIPPDDLVPVPEHPLQPRPDQQRISHGADRAERWRVLDPVAHDGGSRAVGLEPVDVPPAAERSLDLLVGELAVLLEVDVAGDPAQSHRGPDLEHHAAPVPDTARALDHLRMLPRRREPLEGAIPLVPPERRTRREGEMAGAFQGRGGAGCGTGSGDIVGGLS